MAKQSKAQQAVVERVMHEFKEGELQTQGRKVKNPKQAIAIALSEAGASNRQTDEQNARRLRRSRAKGRGEDPRTRADLLAEARRRDVPGRSRMTKDQLIQALRG